MDALHTAPTPADAAALAKKIESAVWNATLRSFHEGQRYWQNRQLRFQYVTKLLSMAFNLKNPKNPALQAKVVGGDIAPTRLVAMTPYELFPELWDPVFERVAHQQLRKQLTHDLDTVPDGAFKCSKCGSLKTTFYLMQTRSADEPMTVFIQCLACSKRWKQ